MIIFILLFNHNMKNAIVTSIALLLSSNVFAQCIVDGGPPKHLCAGDTSSHVFEAVITKGIAPFKIAWSYYYKPFPGRFKAYIASDYLNDTTILNPTIRDFYPDNQERFITIEVIDSTGAKCSDFVEVTSSTFFHDLDATPKFVREGDSIKLCFPSHSGGGFEPYQSYKWSLGDNISGSDSGDCIYTKPIYEADCSQLWGPYIGKRFTVIAKDAYGCPVRDGDDVAMSTTGLSENGLSRNSCYIFNNQNNTLSFLPTSSFLEGIISIYDIAGKKVVEEYIQTGTEISLSDKLVVNGVYIVKIGTKSTILETKKIYFTRN
jgi:hypothetical protein